MELFKKLENNKQKDMENKVLEYWDNIDILNATIENRNDKENFVFYEGPPTANGMPGIHHVMSRVLKDTICKYKTMSGYKVLRKAGWDTHGLPVELQVEKELGLKSKKDIEKYGILEFNKKCKESVWKNEDAFNRMTKEMGYFLDLKNPYVTYDNKYIETEWYILNEFYKKGLIYEGHHIAPYCARCGTGLASHEVAQGYKEIKTDTVVVKMKLVESDAYLLVWTTTPWTLISNVAVCVNPKVTYVYVKHENETYVVSKSLVNTLFEDYEIIKECMGTDLEHLKYEQLMPFINVDNAFYVTCDEYVTTTDGTGIVHIAPAFGEDDYNVSVKYNLPVVNPVDLAGKYTEGPWINTFVIDADADIIKYLKEENKLFKKQKIDHNYPHCWRCSTPLLYYSKPSYYIKMSTLKDKMIENNNTVNWHPNYIGEKRFGNWLNNLKDWAISRNRYWGTPLNLWKCECGHTKSIGSIKELVELAIEDIDDTIELHRPFIDDVHIKCECGCIMNRVPDVIDCWFDSGSMPYAQYHYPFENKELAESQFPADFICEGVDQTRGWFYTLLAISTFLKGSAPYKNVLVNDMLLDKHGLKMSKSKGNIIDPFNLFEEYGADVTRFYLMHASPCYIPTKFDIDGLKEINSKFLSTLKNTYSFFSMYANIDNIDPRTYELDMNKRPLIDKWIISSFNNLVRNVREALDEYELTRAVKHINVFLNDDLSNWYIRRNRKRFWASELDDDKLSVYKTTYEILTELLKLLAPFTPFITEELYQNLTGKKSVHLEDYPVYNEALLDNDLEENMNLVRDLISLGRNKREELSIKIRQPISEIILDSKYEKNLSLYTDLILEELNIKTITYENELNKYMNFSFKPNFKIAGKIFGKDMKEFTNYLNTVDINFVNNINEDTKITLNNMEYALSKDYIEIVISSKENFDVSTANNKFVILNTNLTNELKIEGMAREIISKVQNLRKTINFNITDNIVIEYNGSELIDTVINTYNDFIKSETLSIDIVKKETLKEEYDINGESMFINIRKAD